jgi:hypothetical protein
MRKGFFAIAVLMGLGIISPPVQATVITPGGGNTPLTPLVSLPAGQIVSNGGKVTVEPFIGLFHGHEAAVGTLYLAVYREAATGFLDFLYQIQYSKISQDAVMKQLTADVSAAKSYIDASYIRSLGKVPAGFLNVKGEQAPTSAFLSADGTTVGFNFGHGEQGLGPGRTTDVFMFRTHVKGFRTGATKIHTRETDNILPSFAPGPEPSTLVLFAGCFVGLAGWTGWRRWKGRAVAQAVAS